MKRRSFIKKLLAIPAIAAILPNISKGDPIKTFESSDLGFTIVDVPPTFIKHEWLEKKEIMKRYPSPKTELDAIRYYLSGVTKPQPPDSH